MLIRNGLVFTEENIFSPLTIQTNGDKITALSASGFSSALIDTEETIIDASGCYVIPGLTDIHFHGVCGYDFCDDSFEAYEAITKFCLINGVTSICPATMTLPEAKLEHICQTAASFYKRQQLDSAFTQADYKTAKAAMDAGALHVTHLFNAMPSFHHRDTGVIGAAAATINPCRSIGMDHLYGSILPGKKAHFLLLDRNSLEIKRIIKGQPIG